MQCKGAIGLTFPVIVISILCHSPSLTRTEVDRTVILVGISLPREYFTVKYPSMIQQQCNLCSCHSDVEY